MGSGWSKGWSEIINNSSSCEYKTSLTYVLQTLKPENLLSLALEDDMVYDLCKEDSTLRESCIRGAVRRYHVERHFCENVSNRTANFMVVLDTLLQIQEEEENEKLKRRLRKQGKHLLWCIPVGSIPFFRDREGDAARNGEENGIEEENVPLEEIQENTETQE